VWKQECLSKLSHGASRSGNDETIVQVEARFYKEKVLVAAGAELS